MVYSTDRPPGRGPVVAIIGAGASGTLTAVHLLLRAAAERRALRVALIDRHGRYGLGQAYSTTHPAHLVNSPAGRMSGLAGDPAHLMRWADAAGIAHDGFLPRRAYGRYLRDMLADAERQARSVARVVQLTSEVVAIRRAGLARPIRLHLAADGRVDADMAVLATGSLPPAPPFPVPGTDRYIADPWSPGALDGTGDGSPVVVLGTGPTMMDVAIAVTDADPRAVVHAISRHALLPRTHDYPPAAPSAARPVLPGAPGTVRLAAAMRHVRAAVAERPGDWQQVIDAVQLQIPQLWRRLPAQDKHLFLRHVARYWEVHRHRAPPATARRISELRSAGRLSVLRGRVVLCADEPGGLRLRIEQDGRMTELGAGWLVNATGPAPDITASSDPLLRSLIGGGLARPDLLRLGIDAGPDGAVRDAAGEPADDIFTLGPPLRGLWYETTAIPEIRDQAAALARRLCAAIEAREYPGTAA